MTAKYLKGECLHCRGHIEFPAEAAGTTAECPHCGKPAELLLAAPPREPAISHRVIVWTVVALIVFGGLLAAGFYALHRARTWAEAKKSAGASQAMGQKESATPTPDAATANEISNPDDPVVKAGFRLSEIKIEKTKGSTLIYAVGSVTNASSRTRYGVKVEVELLDETGKRIGTTSDYQPTMEPNTRWQFRAPVLNRKAATAKATGITEQQ